MMTSTALPASFVDTLASRTDAHPWAVKLAAMVFVTGLTAAAAQVSVPLPFTAVPFTLQPMMVLVAGLVLGSKVALGSQILYLFAGIVGLPVFAPSPLLPAGALRLIGPTGGYLVAYPIAAWVVGRLAERGLAADRGIVLSGRRLVHRRRECRCRHEPVRGAAAAACGFAVAPATSKNV